MMNYKLLLCSMAMLPMLTACLSESPDGALQEHEAYKDANSLELATVAPIYSYIGGNKDAQGLQGTCRGLYDLNTFSTDEAMLPTRGGDWYDGALWQKLYLHTWTASDSPIGDTWKYLYKVVMLCNRNIETLNAHNGLMSNAQYKADVAELRALRAMFYFYIMDLWGNVPIVTNTLKDVNTIKQSERSEVYRFIVSELTEALPLLQSQQSNRRGNYYGRMTKEVAWFLLAKLYLNSSVYCTDADEATIAEYYKQCIAFCNELEQNGYRLETDYAANFAVRNEVSSENIFTIPMDKSLYANEFQYLFRSRHYAHGSAMGMSAENGTSATLSTCRTYGYGTDNVDTRWYINFYAGPVFTEDSQPVMLTDGQQLSYEPLKIKLDLSGAEYEKTAGARMHKYEIDNTAYADGKLQGNDIVLFRFADVLLMRAEAKTRLGQDGSDDLNAVRRRVNMPEFDLQSMTAEEQMQTLLDERLRELMWEGWRRNDLIRFGRFHKTYDQRPQLPGEESGYTTLFPIPGGVIGMNSNIKQNPGY